jgi:GDPmannose 4,6-dehydratase
VPRALITGITGQDGRYLSELLTAKGYDVYGLVRDALSAGAEEVRRLVPGVSLVVGDMSDLQSLVVAIDATQPDEVYNLAAQSVVGRSWEQAVLTADVTGTGTLRLLEAIRIATRDQMDGIRFYQASSSEMFGTASETPQRETTRFHPRSPYGAAKAFAHHLTVNYRESYGAFACCGILFNHESPRRSAEFVTRKVTKAVARISLGLQDTLTLGNLTSRRDRGFAGDYVEAMWKMLQQDEPGDFIVATGETYSVADTLDVAFGHVGVDDWRPLVRTDDALARPAEVDVLCGDASRAREVLGWKPTVGFAELIRMMVDADLAFEQENADI